MHIKNNLNITFKIDNHDTDFRTNREQFNCN